MRVCALFNNNKCVIGFFSMTWLFVFSSSIVLVLDTGGIQIGNTNLVFIATSWAFLRYSDVNLKNGVRVLVLGSHLPAFSKSILRDGQAYYLAVLILNLLFTVLCYMPQPPIFPCALGVPFIVMLNIMSSHIYRNVRFGYYRDYSITSSAIDGVIQGFDESAHSNHAIIFEHSTRTKLDLEVEEVISSSRNSKGDLDPV